MDVQTERLEKSLVREPKEKLQANSCDDRFNSNVQGETLPELEKTSSADNVNVGNEEPAFVETAAALGATSVKDDSLKDSYTKSDDTRPLTSALSEQKCASFARKPGNAFEERLENNEHNDVLSETSDALSGENGVTSKEHVSLTGEIKHGEKMTGEANEASEKNSSEQSVASETRFDDRGENAGGQNKDKNPNDLPVSGVNDVSSSFNSSQMNDEVVLADENCLESGSEDIGRSRASEDVGNCFKSELRSEDASEAEQATSVDDLSRLTRSAPEGTESQVNYPKSDSDTEAVESSLPTTEQLDSIKEPEEPDHKDSCDLLHDDSTHSVDETKDKTESANDDGWIYVLGHEELKKRVIKAGVKNSRPVRGQLVNISCVGHLEDGTEVDKHENLTMTLGDGDLIHAFDLCVALMDKGEICEVVTASRFAYGELGRVPEIPPNASLSYILELIDFQDSPDYATMSVADRIKLSDEKRERGNYLYSRNEFSRSIDFYTRALKAIDEDFECHGESAADLQTLADTRVKCHNNMAAAQMKINAWDAAAKSCDVVLKVQPDNVKALFRKGKCLANKGEVAEAVPLLKRALKLEPETKIILHELSRLEKKNKAQAETEKALYQKMLGTDKEQSAAEKKNLKNGSPSSSSSSSKWMFYAAGGVAAILMSLGLTAYRYAHV